MLKRLRWSLAGVPLLAAWACTQTTPAPTPPAEAATDAATRTDAASTDAASTDATGADARDASPRDGAACVDAKVDAPCQPGDRPCGSVDSCCVGYVMMCDAPTGTWKKAGVGCPCRSVPCGPNTCLGTQFCRVRAPGIRFPDGAVPPPSYECTDFPDACKNDWTCACLSALPSSPSCLSNPPGAPCTVENERPLQQCMGQ